MSGINERDSVRMGKKAEKRPVPNDFEDEDEDKERPKTRGARAPVPYPPDGSQYRLIWNEYFLDLPRYVTYRQYNGWQRVLDCIPSAQQVAINGTHIATNRRLPPGTSLRNIPSLPDWIPKTVPIIVLQAFVYSNTRATWSDLTKRMGYSWAKTDIKQMYRFSNKYITAAGRWKNMIGVPSRETKFKLGEKSAVPKSVNYASIVWDDYILLPPHCPNPPLPQLPGIPNPDQAGAGADTGETAAATGAAEPRRTRRKARSTMRAGPEEAVSARPYYGPSPRSAAPGPSSVVLPNQELEREVPASPGYLEAAALRARYAMLCNQELIARMLARTAARERKAVRAQVSGEGVMLDPDQEELDWLLEQEDETALLPSPLEQAVRTLRSSSCSSLITGPQPSPPGQHISPPQPAQSATLLASPSPPELSLFRPPDLFNQARDLKEAQDQNGQFLHDFLNTGAESPLNNGFPPSSDPHEWDHYFKMLEPSDNAQGGIGGEWPDLPPFDMLGDPALPVVGWDSQQLLEESGPDHGLETAQVRPQSISGGSVDSEVMYDVIRQYLEDRNEIGQMTSPPRRSLDKGKRKASPGPSSEKRNGCKRKRG